MCIRDSEGRSIAYGWRASAAGRSGVVRVDGESFQLGIRVEVVHWRFFGEGDGAFGADATGGYVASFVAEDETLDRCQCPSRGRFRVTYRNDVKEANDDGKDTRSKEQTPEWQTQRLLACSLLVHVAEHIEPQHRHGASQSNKAMARAKQGPVASKVAPEERALRNDEEHCGMLDVS